MGTADSPPPDKAMRMAQLDIIIRDAQIVDGSGSPAYRGDAGILGGRIEAIGELPPDIPAAATIDAGGLTLAPGFIDIHNHSDFLLLRDPRAASKLAQGVTTQVIGQCGLSPAPVTDTGVALLAQYTGFVQAGAEPSWQWRTFADWLHTLEQLELGTNVAAMVGQGTIRVAVLGFDARAPTRAELGSMRAWVEEAMEAGAFGMTTGLIYEPGVYSSRDELAAVAAGLRATGGLYVTHLRSEGDQVSDALTEALFIAERNRIPCQISHLKALGKSNWGRSAEILARLEAARAAGMDVTADQYPYTIAGTTLRAILPPWARAGGVVETVKRLRTPHLRKRIANEMERDTEWENLYLHSGGSQGVILLDTPRTPQFEGLNLEQVAARTGGSPIEAALDVICANAGADNACYAVMSDADVEAILSTPWVMIGSDGIPCASGAKCHPRVNGTFARVLGRFVRERGVLGLEEAIRRMTALPAARLGLGRKGLLRVGMDADLVLFDPGAVADRADLNDPHRLPKGIDSVFVNGRGAWLRGRSTGVFSGRVLRAH